MYKFFLASLLLLTSFLPLQAQGVINTKPSDTDGCQCQVPVECRVYNETGCQCVWNTIETLARTHKIEKLYGLCKRQRGYACSGSVNQELIPLLGSSKYYHNPEGNTGNLVFVKQACANGWGCCVGLGNGSGSWHAITIVHYKDGVVKFIDNVDRSLSVRTMTEDRFRSRWNGWALALDPRK